MAHRQDTGKQADVNSVQYCACCAAQPQSTTATQEKCQRAASRAVVPRLCLPNRPCKTQCTYGRQQQARPQPWAGRRIRRRCAGRDDGLGCRKCASPVFRHPRRRADAPPDGRVVVLLCRPSPAPSEAPGQGRPRARGPRLTPASFHFHRWERQGSRVRPRGAACRRGAGAGGSRWTLDDDQTGKRLVRHSAIDAVRCAKCALTCPSRISVPESGFDEQSRLVACLGWPPQQQQEAGRLPRGAGGGHPASRHRASKKRRVKYVAAGERTLAGRQGKAVFPPPPFARKRIQRIWMCGSLVPLEKRVGDDKDVTRARRSFAARHGTPIPASPARVNNRNGRADTC